MVMVPLPSIKYMANLWVMGWGRRRREQCVVVCGFVHGFSVLWSLSLFNQIQVHEEKEKRKKFGVTFVNKSPRRSMAYSGRQMPAIPPDKGSFPLDHEGRCKKEMQVLMGCLKEMQGENMPCRSISVKYLECRMEQ